MRNKTRKIVKINKNELEKCKVGKEFNVDFITYTDTTPRPPREAPAWFREFVKNEFKPLAVQVNKLETTQKQQGEVIAQIQNDFKQLKIDNNLK